MRTCRIVAVVCAVFLISGLLALVLRAAYPRPYRETVSASGVPWSLAYAVMKAESNFRTDAVSHAGAIGVMQIKPATAEYICAKRGVAFEADRLSEGEYNAKLGCMYLRYLLEHFSDETAAVCAYNAGEGKVREWLANGAYSPDGTTLTHIPYSETRIYAKKVADFRKIYEIFYG